MATTLYTLATINNSFEHDVNPLVGLFDSHVSAIYQKFNLFVGYEFDSLRVSSKFQSQFCKRTWLFLNDMSACCMYSFLF